MECNKVSFTYKQAATALNQAKKHRQRGNKRRQESRKYYCHECKSWHLTSKAELF